MLSRVTALRGSPSTTSGAKTGGCCGASAAGARDAMAAATAAGDTSTAGGSACARGGSVSWNFDPSGDGADSAGGAAATLMAEWPGGAAAAQRPQLSSQAPCIQAASHCPHCRAVQCSTVHGRTGAGS